MNSKFSANGTADSASTISVRRTPEAAAGTRCEPVGPSDRSAASAMKPPASAIGKSAPNDVAYPLNRSVYDTES
ncbi:MULTISPECIES: hypothetical protein [unclassified Caballeronia]|uniref:hypothetical protein n=1 Tax=unclassified Caballeronia TaxID=2646786 RepID=UPI002028CCB1|nr:MULTISPECIES: hypothetical protein [unclassified Caballeronia]MDR5804205.1 hypothetical protein [Caballeronia sp. LZ001]